MNAFNREYENDNSWEQLQEDEYGHLRPLVSAQAICHRLHAAAQLLLGKHLTPADRPCTFIIFLSLLSQTQHIFTVGSAGGQADMLEDNCRMCEKSREQSGGAS